MQIKILEYYNYRFFLNKKIMNLISLDEKVTEKPTNRLINNENNNKNKYSLYSLKAFFVSAT